MNEIWKDIPDYENFQVSNTNKVRKKDFTFKQRGAILFGEGSELTTSKNKKGYQRVELCIGKNKKKAFTVHRLVMYAFKGTPPKGFDQINHIDGNKLNNHPDNLEWSNNSHNIKHAWRMGLFKPNLPGSLRSPHALIVVHKECGYFCTLIEAAKECGIERTKLSKMVKNIIRNNSKYIIA